MLHLSWNCIPAPACLSFVCARAQFDVRISSGSRKCIEGGGNNMCSFGRILYFELFSVKKKN